MRTAIAITVDELLRLQDVLFHRGRCLPYGESITFTALEEIVRALIGVGPGQDRRSVAEVSALVSMPIGVVRVLLADLVELGQVRVQTTIQKDSSLDERRELIERTLRGLRTL